MKKYAAYGLTFESEFDLPPIPPVESDQVDVRILSGAVSAHGLATPNISKAIAQIAEAEVWMDIPNIARIQISDGKQIMIEPYPGSDEKSIGLYIMGSGMGAILHQRGHLVLHANAIRMGDSVVLFAGASGSGKSTTAATFYQKGYEIISDDVVALDEQGSTIGGIPQIKLWHDALEGLNIPVEGLDQIRLQINKYSFPIDSFDNERHLPIRAIYILGAANEQDPNHFDLTQLTGMAKFDALKRHTYRRHFMEGLGMKPIHLERCAQLASGVHMAHIIRPTGHFNAPQLVERVLQDLESAGLNTEPD